MERRNPARRNRKWKKSKFRLKIISKERATQCHKSLKRNYPRNFKYFDQAPSSSNFSNINKFKDNNSIANMSTWFWSNYQKAFDWRKHHQEAYWKSCAISLNHENQYLWKLVQDLTIDSNTNTDHENIHSKTSTTVQEPKQEPINDYCESASPTEVNFGETELAFEMSEEMIEYFAQSFKHKMELKKSKMKTEPKSDDEEEEVKKAHKMKLQREKEMKLLYGEGASMIVGMETAIQLSFDKYCDLRSPQYWPNIPLNL